ncbi:MAG: RimK family protein [Balneolaceae bacterium]|nr:RimK family protein [Balneolaceae bacterium]
MHQLVVVNNPENWLLDIPGVQVISAKNYITDPQYIALRNAKVFNLSRSYRYQTLGYYVSLLATARGHKPFPNVLAIQDLKSKTIIRIVSDELDVLIQKSLKPIQGKRFTLSIYFGKNLAKRYDKLSGRLFDHFQAPLLRAEFFRKDKEWFLKNIQPIATSEIPGEHRPFVSEMAQEFFKKRYRGVSKKESRYDLAILVNPDEKMPPSNEKAIRKFIQAAEALHFYTELITKDDASRLNEFDALFIRETTHVNHHTYRMARRAAAEGLIVIDDPESILKCTNKVYLAELLNKHNIPAPDTLIIQSVQTNMVQEKLGFPCILKQPDSSFSQGVVKADNVEEFVHMAENLFEKSELLIVQRFIPTEFDWRVGILNRCPLFACKYFMARQHWQIYERPDDGKIYEGDSETIPADEIPPHVLDTAIKAAALIGDGLYGVDLKEVDNQSYVIEVNDNPSVDAGLEDAVLKDELYRKIMLELLRRIEEKKKGTS